MSLYETLGVAEDADVDEIKRAHRKAARKHHPDMGGNRAAFEQVQHAYMVLSDSDRRERYDRTGEVDLKVNNELGIITALIMSAFDTAVQQNEHFLTSKDLIAATRKLLERGQVELSSIRAQVKAERSKLQGLHKRLRFNGEGPDPIGGALLQRIAGAERNLDKIDKDKADLAKAIAFLDNYGFDFDRAQTATVIWASAGTATGSSA